MTTIRLLSVVCLLTGVTSWGQGPDSVRLDLRDRPPRAIYEPVDLREYTGWAVEGGVHFPVYKWDIGNFSFDQLSLVPQIGLSYAATDNLDLRANLAGGSLSDRRVEIAEGIMMSPNFRFFRPGAGIRLWINRQTEFPLYLDAQLNYYLISGSDFEMRSSPASISGTLGTGYNFAQGIGLRAGLVVESSIQNGRTRFNRVERDFSLSSIGLGFGLQYDF